jgi:putative aldouronate transport system substrate-binding protein
MLLKWRSGLFLGNLLLLVVLVAGCATPVAAPAQNAGTASEGTTAPSADGEIVDVKYSYGSRGIPRDLQEVQDAINEILNKDLGVNLILDPIDFAAFNDRMQLQLAAGEPCDIIFTAPWINSYTNNVANGSLLPLDDLLKKEAPGLWASMPETTWNAARINGKIYGAINQQIFVTPWGVHVRKDLLDKYNFSLDSVTKWEDMEPFLQAVKEGEGITPVYADDGNIGSSLFLSQYYGYDALDDGIGFIGIKADDETLTVVNLVDTPEYREAANLSKKWVDAGYFPSTLSAVDEATASFRAGLFAMGYHNEKPGVDAEWKQQYGWDFESKILTDPMILNTAGATATMNGICATSQHPVEAMRVLEQLNTDPVVYNLLSHGIEGKHWVWVDDSRKLIDYPEGIDASTSGYDPNTDWMFGNQFNAYYRSPAQVGAWEATKKMNDEGYPSKAMGFVVDRTPIQTEVAQTTAVLKEFGRPITYGWVSYDEAAPDLLKRLNDAGAQKIIDEVQRQLNDWKAAQGQ